jgi:hypothetical protein
MTLCSLHEGLLLSRFSRTLVPVLLHSKFFIPGYFLEGRRHFFFRVQGGPILCWYTKTRVLSFSEIRDVQSFCLYTKLEVFLPVLLLVAQIFFLPVAGETVDGWDFVLRETWRFRSRSGDSQDDRWLASVFNAPPSHASKRVMRSPLKITVLVPLNTIEQAGSLLRA